MQRRDIVAAMKNHPRVIAPLYSKLQSLEVPEPHVVLSRQAQHNNRLARAGFASSAGGAPAAVTTEGNNSKKSPSVPLRAKVLEDLSFTLLRDHILAALQPSVLSSRNVKVACCTECFVRSWPLENCAISLQTLFLHSVTCAVPCTHSRMSQQHCDHTWRLDQSGCCLWQPTAASIGRRSGYCRSWSTAPHR